MNEYVVRNGLEVIGDITLNGQIISTASGDTAPLVVDSSFLVTNLNADLLDGLHASTFSHTGHTHDDIYYRKNETDDLLALRVSTGTTVNGHDLSTDIYVTANETGAYSSGQTDVLLNAIDQSKWEPDNITYVTVNTHWDIPLNFNAKGYRVSNGAYTNDSFHGYWWSLSGDTSTNAVYYDKISTQLAPSQKVGLIQNGMSVRIKRPINSGETSLTEGTLISNVYTDIDGNTYTGVIVNGEVWITSNLKVTKYLDGSAIPTQSDNAIWKTLLTGAYCVYPIIGQSDSVSLLQNGALYNFNALKDVRGLVDNTSGWTIPTYIEFNILLDYLNGETVAQIDPTPTKVKPKDGKNVDARFIVNLPNYDSMYEPIDPALQAHIVVRGNPHATTADEVNAVTKNNSIVGATHTKITYDYKGLVTSGVDATTADINPSLDRQYVTDVDAIKLPGIETGAQVNIIENVYLNDVYQTVSGKTIHLVVTANQSGAYTSGQTDHLLTLRVSTGTTVNGHNLSTDIFVSAADTGAYTSGQTDALLNTKSGTGHTHSQLHDQNTDNTLLSPDKTKTVVYTDNDGNLFINGDIIQSGVTYETHVQQVYTKDDTIILREGAVAGLAVGEYAGFVAKLYDGVNDGQLVFDKDGIARVGDSGSTQAIATREDNPTNDYIVKWNSGTTRFETIVRNTSSIPSTTDLRYVTDANVIVINNTSNVNSGDEVYIGSSQPSSGSTFDIWLDDTGSGTTFYTTTEVDNKLNLKSNKTVQIQGLTLLVSGWNLVGGLYENNLSHILITSLTYVDVIPDNSSIINVNTAQFYPTTVSSNGSVKVYCKNLPTSNIGVTINIYE